MKNNHPRHIGYVFICGCVYTVTYIYTDLYGLVNFIGFTFIAKYCFVKMLISLESLDFNIQLLFIIS